MKPHGQIKPCDGLAYELHEIEEGSIFAIPETEEQPKLWVIKTDTTVQKDGLTVVLTTVIGVEKGHKASDAVHPGQTVMLREDTYVLPADIDIYMEGKCVFRTFLEERPGQDN